jgi:aspartate dehydrogenase
MLRVGLIGLGAIGAAICDVWDERLCGTAELCAVLVRPDRAIRAAARLRSKCRVVTDLAAFLAEDMTFVVEAAGHAALSEYGEQVLLAGCELLMMSVGALADDRLRERLERAAELGHGRLLIPAGALAGFDGLMSLRAAGLASVTYYSAKPPCAWAGTAAEECCNLEALEGHRVFFSGTAREAAAAFPRNANLAAAVALAGLGFDRTNVELAADPSLKLNASRIVAETETESERLDVTLYSAAFEENPKTSRITAMSAISALQSQSARIGFR